MNASELTVVLTGGILLIYALFIIYKEKHKPQH